MICTFNDENWLGPFSIAQKELAIRALESGEVLYFPNLGFAVDDTEIELLMDSGLDRKTKNISFNQRTQTIKGTSIKNQSRQNLQDMMNRFSNCSTNLIHALFPKYRSSIVIGRTSFRPAEILGRKTSIRKDDTRLHVDAFPATPNQGQRILRVFSNINPEERDRIWNIGQPFQRVVERFGPRFKKPIFGMRKLMSWIKITKSYRTLYDHYMLQLHDHMKFDDEYQQDVEKLEFHFPPGSTWIVMTDCVSHAALVGQFMLEQTFYLPIEAMEMPELSPLKILENYLEKRLI